MKKRDGSEYLYSKRFTRHNHKSNPLFRKFSPKASQATAPDKPPSEMYDVETIQMLNSCKQQFKLLNKQASEILSKENNLSELMDNMTSNLKTLNKQSIVYQKEYL